MQGMGVAPGADVPMAVMPELKWRGIVLPVADRHCGFAHELAITPIMFHTDMVDSLVLGGRVFSYTMPMVEGMIKPYREAFSKAFPEFLAAYQNRDPGPLVDPVHGEVRCVPFQWDDSSGSSFQGGVLVKASFRESPAIDAIDMPPETISFGVIVQAAKQLDSAILALPNTSLPKLPTQTFTQMLAQIRGLGDQVIFAGGKAIAKLHDIAYHCERIVQTFDRLVNPGETFQARAAAQRLHKVAHAVIRRSDLAKVTQTLTVNYTKELGGFAAIVGMTIADLVTLNPSLRDQRCVRPGMQIRVMKRASNGR